VPFGWRPVLEKSNIFLNEVCEKSMPNAKQGTFIAIHFNWWLYSMCESYVRLQVDGWIVVVCVHMCFVCVCGLCGLTRPVEPTAAVKKNKVGWPAMERRLDDT
jgi:hypothetical protein